MNTIKRFFSNLIHKWNSLKVSQKRRLMTVALIALALILFLIALIVGIASCSNDRTEEAAEPEAAAPLPALLRAPDSAEPTDPEQTGTEEQSIDPIYSDPDDPNTEDPNDDPIDDPTVGQTAEPADPESEYQPLKKHDKGEEVTQLQERLMKLGYLEIEETTDYFGSSTEYAVELFQRQHDLKQDGIAGVETLKLLYSDDAQHYTLKEGAEGRDVKMLQEQLVDLGYLASSDVDRIYGSVTIEAVKAFQKRNGLTQSGEINAKTQEKLESAKAKPAQTASVKKTPTPKPDPKKTATPKPGATGGATASSTASGSSHKKGVEKLIEVAESKLGCRYVRGAKGPNSFDCSGFVYWCLNHAGVRQSYMTSIIWRSCSKYKRISSMSALKRGDILVFKGDSMSTGHVGIYLGDGSMIDASSSEGKIRITNNIQKSKYWTGHFLMAYRIWD